MIGMPEPHAEVEVKRQKLMELAVGSLEERISLDIRILSPVEWDETAHALSKRSESSGRRLQDSLSFLSVKSTLSTYPDTGESGDAYDAEAFLDH